jgi:hypothetical protein
VIASVRRTCDQAVTGCAGIAELFSMNEPSAFESLLCHVLSGVFGPLKADDGYSLAQIESAARRLGHQLPAVLATAYAVGGRHAALRKGMQNLVGLRALARGSFTVEKTGEPFDALVFLREQQGVTFSAIAWSALAEPDPPVYQVNPTEGVAYYDSPSLSTFILSAICWNSMELNVSGSVSLTAAQCSRVRDVLTPLRCGPLDENPPVEAYCRPPLAACIFRSPSEPHGTLYVSAPTDEALQAFEQETGIEVSWH